MTSSLEAPPQVAIDDFGSPEAFLAAIDATIKYFNDGDIVTGTVVKVDRDEVLLDIGYKTEGVIPSKELSIKHDVDPFDVVSVGDEIEALVQQKEDKEGRLILSKKRAQYERAWGTIEKIKEEDGVVTGSVIEVVKGGLIIDIGLRGFLPASLVEMRRVRDLQPYVGMELEAKIIELDKNRNNVVLSRRAWLEQTQSEVRQSFLTQLQAGQIRKGVVSSIVNFGAFVDLGGVDGLVHVSELSWKHIDHPSEVVEVGQEVTVEVLSVELDRERVSLSLKATQEDPWQAFARTHQIGQIVPGKVTKLVPFGAFVRVEEGIEGLVHVSELAERHVEIPEQVVQVNDDVMVKIIDIDLERRRISLSLKQANEGVDAGADDFDPTLYGMAASYDDQGNYLYPEGFDPETGEWLPGLRRAAARLGAAVRRGARPLGSAQEAGRGRRERRERTDGGADHVLVQLRVERPGGSDRSGRLAGIGRGTAEASREAHRRQLTPQHVNRGPLTVRVGGPRCFLRQFRHGGRRILRSDRASGGAAPVWTTKRADNAFRPRARGGRQRALAPTGCEQEDRQMLRVGLTGGIASGKSLVADELARYGAVVIDADVLAREVVEPGTPGLAAIEERFGADVLTDGRLDRAALGKIIFSDPEARRDLERIVHPAVRARAAELEQAAAEDATVIHVIPLLVETGQQDGFDVVVVVDVDQETQVRRLLDRNGLTSDEAGARIAAQASREARLAAADHVLHNDGTVTQLKDQIADLWDKLLTRGALG